MDRKIMPWEGTFPPLRMLGNLYFVGSRPASVHIVDTGDGLVMLDSGYRESLYEVIDNIYRVGLDPHRVKYLLLTHGHIDHMGAARAFRELTGARIVLGRADREYANGTLPLSYASELEMSYTDPFEPDILVDDGYTLTLGNTTFRAMATPGHTPGAMSWFFEIREGGECYKAALHGGMGINTLSREFLDKYRLPYTLRDDFLRSMMRLSKESVDVFLGNHMQHNHTEEKAERVKSGDRLAFVSPDEWKTYSLWCIENLNAMIEREGKA